MPETKLNRAQKREIFEAMHNAETAQDANTLARKYGVSAQYIRQLYRNASNSEEGEFSFMPCWQCGQEPVKGKFYCSSDCEIAWKKERNARHGLVFSRAHLDAIPEYELIDET